MINNEILANCKMQTLEEYISLFGDAPISLIAFYETFLRQTDYVAAKIAEGVATVEDYTNILGSRNFAREEINRLEKIKQEGKTA